MFVQKIDPEGSRNGTRQRTDRPRLPEASPGSRAGIVHGRTPGHGPLVRQNAPFRFGPGRDWTVERALEVSGRAASPAIGHRVASGEGNGPLNEENEWLPATGNGPSTPSAQPTVTPSTTPSAPPTAAPAPRLAKSTVSPLVTLNNGGFSWGARWSILNATSATNGWIVQHVVVSQNVAAWHPPLAPGTTRPITTGQAPYGGLSTSWYPLWEAWQVRGGVVYVGGGTGVHNADTYAQPPVGPNTVGTTAVVGRADFYPNATLPSTMRPTNGPPAWSLPATNSDPGLTGGTGALDHNLTATWDGVNGTGVTTATTV